MAKKNDRGTATDGAWFYLLRSTDMPGLYKPGIATNFSKRLAQHGGEEKWEQVELAELGRDRAYKFEQRILKQFKGQKLNAAGEYLHLDAEHLDELQKLLDEERLLLANELEAKAHKLRDQVSTRGSKEKEEWLLIYRPEQADSLLGIACLPPNLGPKTWTSHPMKGYKLFAQLWVGKCNARPIFKTIKQRFLSPFDNPAVFRLQKQGRKELLKMVERELEKAEPCPLKTASKATLMRLHNELQ